MKSWKNVAIVGVGLLGGSIGLGLIARRLADRVIGVGRDATRLRRAQTLGAITEFTTDLESLSEGPEMVVICTPVATIVPHVLAFAHRARDRMIITDVGSTKAQILHDVARAWPGDQRVSSGVIRWLGATRLARNMPITIFWNGEPSL